MKRAVICLCMTVVLLVAMSSLVHSTDQPKSAWQKAELPFAPLNIATQDGVMWACGTGEGIAKSIDGGASWQLRHTKGDGDALLAIAFVDAKIGHAAGTGGLLLTTKDGGETWTEHRAPAIIRKLSFADENNGIAIVGGSANVPEDLLDEANARDLNGGTVYLTQDGGAQWKAVDALTSDERFNRHTHLLSVAALTASKFLVAIHQDSGNDLHVYSLDGGKTWDFIAIPDTYAGRVFTHDGEYWAFGIEYLEREKRGGYGAPVSLHSKDGRVWVHGIRGPNEFGACTVQGCVVGQGTIINLYGAKPQVWWVPQDGTFSPKWAMVKDTVCTVKGGISCTKATPAEKTQEAPVDKFGMIRNAPIVPPPANCLYCDAVLPELSGSARVQIQYLVRKDGRVKDVQVKGAPDTLADSLKQQVQEWVLEPTGADTRGSVDFQYLCRTFSPAGMKSMSSCFVQPSRTTRD